MYNEVLNFEVQRGTVPAPVAFHDSIFIFWNGPGDEGIFFSRKTAKPSGYDGWSAKKGLRECIEGVGVLSATSLAAVVLGERLYLFWHGSGRDGFFYTSTGDGERWEQPASIGAALNGAMAIGGDHSPCVAVHEGRIHLFWRGYHNRDGLFWATFDGSGWSFGANLSERIAGHGVQKGTMPAAGVIEGDGLYLFWSGSGKDGLFYATLRGDQWSGARSLRDHIGGHGIRDGASPSVSTVQGRFYVFWPGSGGDGFYWAENVGGTFREGQRSILSLIPISLDHASMPLAVHAAAASGEEKIEFYWAQTDLTSSRERIYFADYQDKSSWMSRVGDEVLISALDLPGTHDTAAIKRGVDPSEHYKHPWVCQNLSIGEQLASGVRVLDIRIQAVVLVTSTLFSHNYSVALYTCHGDIELAVGANQFQTLHSAFAEVREFLVAHPSEVVVVIMKIDQIKRVELTVPLLPIPSASDGAVKEESLKAISDLLRDYDKHIYNILPRKTVPKLGELRGKIFLLNRFKDGDSSKLNPELNRGDDLVWHDNKAYPEWHRSGETASNPGQPVSIALQDRFENIDRNLKVEAFIKHVSTHSSADIFLNYASCTAGKLNIEKPLIQPDLIESLDENKRTTRESQSIKRLGWALFDFVGTYCRAPRTGEAVNAIDYVLSFNDYAKPFPLFERLRKDV